MASWNCCLAGTADESTPISINLGDTIVGTTEMTCSAGTTLCPTWNVIGQDQTTNQSTELSATPSDGQTFYWAFGGVLEVYSVIQCYDYPPNASLTISSLLYDNNLNLVAPNWIGSGGPALSVQPQCNYGVTTSGTQTTLTYGTTGAGFGLGLIPTSASGMAVNQGSSASSTIAITDINGFSGSVELSVSNPPTGVTAQVTQGPSAKTYTLTLTATSAAALTGANTPAALTLTASSPGVATQTFPVNVIVNPPLTGGVGTSVNLSGAYNAYGFYDDVDQSAITPANSLDESGRVYSANQLSPPGTAPMELNFDGIQFAFGRPNQLDSVYGAGTNSIGLPSGQFNSLNILAMAAYGPYVSQILDVTYTDGTTQQFTQTFDDWYSADSCTSSNPCAAGELVAVAMPYRDYLTSADGPCYLYEYSFALNSSKTVKNLTLPNNRRIVVLAVTLANTASTPTFSPVSGTYTSAQTVTISTATPAATIYYTTDGTKPTVSSAVYGGPITVSSTATIQAIAVANGYVASPVASASYTLISEPAVTSSPANLTFAGETVGTASAAQTVTLTNSGTAALSITAVAASGDFADTSACGPSIAAGASCMISVTFTPTAAGTRTGTLTVTDNASSSPQTVALSGGGEAFSVAASSPGLTITSAGGSATASIQLSSVDGYSGTVNLTCTVAYQGSGTPTDPPSCSLSPAQAQVTSTTPASSTLTVSTTAATASAAPGHEWETSGVALATMIFLGFLPRRRWRGRMVLFLLFLAMIGGAIGCGGGTSGGGSSTPQPNPGTTTGSYQVVVTATSGTVVTSTTISLSLQ